VSAFGGIVGCNGPVDEALAAELRELFLEAVVAPSFTEGALAVLAKKKKLRVVAAEPSRREQLVWRGALGGILLQQQDTSVERVAEGDIRTTNKPTPEQLEDLQFAWTVCKHVKSNAIVFARDRRLVGVGAGQMSRVDSVQLAISKARSPVEGCVLASDAFFPFRDGIDQAAAAGAVAVVQPGGSVRDEEVIAAANEHGLSMVFTGTRHFRH
jgi:phosphoribosylaminoimidazolecarboxamide formyltransferase/IMP cyclohydrolase